MERCEPGDSSRASLAWPGGRGPVLKISPPGMQGGAGCLRGPALKAVLTCSGRPSMNVGVQVGRAVSVVDLKGFPGTPLGSAVGRTLPSRQARLPAAPRDGKLTPIHVVDSRAAAHGSPEGLQGPRGSPCSPCTAPSARGIPKNAFPAGSTCVRVTGGLLPGTSPDWADQAPPTSTCHRTRQKGLLLPPGAEILAPACRSSGQAEALEACGSRAGQAAEGAGKTRAEGPGRPLRGLLARLFAASGEMTPHCGRPAFTAGGQGVLCNL